jgi:amino acid transporter
MARDRQLPSFLAKVHERKGVPVNATLLVAVVSLVLGLYFSTRDDGISLLSTLVNFGALTAFLALHVSVVWHFVGREGSRQWWTHLLAPAIGFAILAYVLLNAQLQAKWLGLIWFGIGLAVLVVLMATGRRPELAMAEEGTR